MISHQSQAAGASRRRTVRTGVLLAALAVLLFAAPASADVPVGWSDPDDVTAVQMLWIFVGAPAALFVVVAVLAWIPGLISGERIGAGGEAENAWFGGPVDGVAELTPAQDDDTGGASARW